MRILEIEAKFQSEETLEEVLTECESDFTQIDYWAGVRKNNLTDNPEEITKALNDLSASYGNLRTVLGIAETELTNREVRKYNMLRMKIEKLTTQLDSATKKEASESVAQYRRIYNLIKAYVETCDKHICTLQSILNRWTKGFNHTQG